MSLFSNFFGFKRPGSKSDKQQATPEARSGELLSSFNSIGAYPLADFPSTPTPRPENVEPGRSYYSPSQSGHPLSSSSPNTPGISEPPVGHRPYPSSPLALAAADDSVHHPPQPIGRGRRAPPPGPPYIPPSEIGTKWPTASYGPGIERKVFFDPGFKRPIDTPNPAENPGEGSSTISPPRKGTRITNFLSNPFKKASKAVGQASVPEGDSRRRSASLPNLASIDDEEEFPFNRPRRIPPPTQSEAQISQSELTPVITRPKKAFPSSSSNTDSTNPNHQESDLERADRANAEEMWRNFSSNTRAVDQPSEVDQFVNPASTARRPVKTKRERKDISFEEMDLYGGDEEEFIDENGQFSTDSGIEANFVLDNPGPQQGIFLQDSSGLQQSTRGPTVADNASRDATFLAHHQFGLEPLYPPPNRPLPSLPPGAYNEHPISKIVELQNFDSREESSCLSGGRKTHLPSRSLAPKTPPRTPANITSIEGGIHGPYKDDDLIEDLQIGSFNQDGPAYLLRQIARHRDSTNSDAQPSVYSEHTQASNVRQDNNHFLRHDTNIGRATPEGMVSVQLEGYDKIFLEANLSSGLSDQGHSIELGRSGHGQTPAVAANEEKFVEEFNLQDAAITTVENNDLNKRNRKGRLAMVLETAGLKHDGRLMKAVEDNERDWETEADASQDDLNLTTRAITGSSLADISDSESLRPSKRVVLHPAHPQYSHTWNMQQDKGSGQMILMPEYRFTDQNRVPNRNALIMPETKQALAKSPHQHDTTPSSTGNDNVFTSSPINPFTPSPVNPFAPSLASPLNSARTNPFLPSPSSPFANSSASLSRPPNTNPFTPSPLNPAMSPSVSPLTPSRPNPFSPSPVDPFVNPSTGLSRPPAKITFTSSPVNPSESSLSTRFTPSEAQIDLPRAATLDKSDQTSSKLSRFWPRKLRFKISKESKITDPILPTNIPRQSSTSIPAIDNEYFSNDRQHQASTTFDNGSQGHSYPSSTWLSTVDRITTGERSDLGRGHDGSFSKMTFLGPRANITGAPDGTGAREVGSSLAGGSSPPDMHSNSYLPNTPFEPITPRQGRHVAGPGSGASSSANAYHRRTVGGSFEMDEFHTNRSASNKAINTPNVKNNIGFLKEQTGHLSSKVRKHREDLVQYSLLAAPSTSEPRRLSVPQEYIGTTSPPDPIKEADSTATIKVGPEVDNAPYAPWNTPSYILGNRTPHRFRNLGEEPATETQADHPNLVTDTISSETPTGKKKKIQKKSRNRRATRAAHREAVVIGKMPANESNDVIASSSIEGDQPGLSILNKDEHFGLSLSRGAKISGPLPSSHGANSLAVRSAIGFNSCTSFEPFGSGSSPGHQSQPGAFNRPYATLYDDLDGIRGRFIPPRPIVRQPAGTRSAAHPSSPQLERPDAGAESPHPHRSTRPVARADSPHLLQVPRQAAGAELQRHKELSRVFLVVCCIAPPIAIIYGHGGFDEAMRHLTHGEMDGFRRQEKLLGLWIGWGSILGVVGALTWAFIHYG